MRLKFLHETFYNSQFKKYNCNSTHSYNREIWVDIPSYIIFPCTNVRRVGRKMGKWKNIGALLKKLSWTRRLLKKQFCCTMAMKSKRLVFASQKFIHRILTKLSFWNCYFKRFRPQVICQLSRALLESKLK